MACIVLKGSTATYVSKEKGWEHRRNKKMVLLEDTRTSAAQYRFKFEEEDITVMVNYENIAWCQKQTRHVDAPMVKFPTSHSMRMGYAN